MSRVIGIFIGLSIYGLILAGYYYVVGKWPWR
jgi:hypothetical protein